MSDPKSLNAKAGIVLPQSIIDSFARHLAAEICAYYDRWLRQQKDMEDTEEA